jgi:hypothetical protein
LLWDIFRIICAIYNTFRAPIIKETSYNELNKDAENIISMLEKSNENDIADNEVNTKQGWKKTSILELKKSCFFPKYTINDIRNWNCGPYQLLLATKYLKHADEFKVYTHNDYPNTIKIKGIISRYSRNDISKKLRTIFLRFDPTVQKGLNDIFAWCSCYNGQRTIGGCAHIIAMLYQILIILTNNNNNCDLYYTENNVSDDHSTFQMIFEKIIDCKEQNNIESDDIDDNISDSCFNSNVENNHESENDKSSENDKNEEQVSDISTNNKRIIINQQNVSRKKQKT